MKFNRYLEKLGLTEDDMPGYYNPRCKDDSKAASDPRNEEDAEGFCSYEFFSLDYTLSLYIYSKLCYFREHIAEIATPGCLTPIHDWNLSKEERIERSNAAHNKWLSIVDKMIEAFRIQIQGYREGYEGIDREKVREGMQLFIEYYGSLWY